MKKLEKNGELYIIKTDSKSPVRSKLSVLKPIEELDSSRELNQKAIRSQEIIKATELSQLRQQRDALMSEVHELNAHIERTKFKHINETDQHTKEVKELKRLLEQQKVNATENERKLKACENKIIELNIQLDKEKNLRQNMPSEKETELRAELQGVKEALRLTEVELATAREDKKLFLGNLAKAADGDSKFMTQKLIATQLLYKDELIDVLQKQLKEISRSKLMLEHKCEHYETNIHKIFAFNKHKCSPAEYIKQEEELIGLQIKLLEVTNRNEELSNQLLEKQEELAQQEKTLRGQTTIIKVREELINMLKHKEGELCRQLSIFQKDLDERMKIVDEVQKEISEKSKEIEYLTSRLESKAQHINCLDQIIAAQENQLRRAQRLRTRHEAMISELGHQLSRSNLSKKSFLIF